MTGGPPAHKILDLCSDDDSPSERQCKRHRKEELKLKPKHSDSIIDLSTSPPQDQDARLPGAVGHGERRLWGEPEEEGPPRWNFARRRSSLCHPSDMDPNAAQALTDRPESVLWPEAQQHMQPLWPRSQRRGARQVLARLPEGLPPPAVVSQAEEGPLEHGHSRTHGDAAMAQRLQQREEAAVARQLAAAERAEAQARRVIEEEELSRRIDELEALEAMEENNACHRQAGSRRSGHRSELPAFHRPPFSHASRSGGRRPLMWAPASLAEAMMGMLSDGSSLAHMQLGALSHHMAAAQQAMGALQGPGRLPAHLLFSDRDFDENDYEALLALDDNVASRKGASAEQIEAIPTVVVGHGGFDAEKGHRCPICLEDIQPGTTLRRLACKHYFHKPCLDKWLGHKSVCPICQQSLN